MGKMFLRGLTSVSLVMGVCGLVATGTLLERTSGVPVDSMYLAGIVLFGTPFGLSALIFLCPVLLRWNS